MRVAIGLLSAMLISGCATDKVAQGNAKRAETLTLDQQIATVENDAKMPPDVKAKLVADLRLQQAAKKSAPAGQN